jgi:20S proteasome subunit beta 2
VNQCKNQKTDPQNERGLKTRNYKFRRGTTAWTKESIRNLIVSEDIKVTSGAGKDQGGVATEPVPTGGPGGTEGMEVDA